MGRDEIIRKRKAAEGTLTAQGVTQAALFGSKARAANQRDIDIVIEDLLPGPVDGPHRGQLKPHVRPKAERDALYAF